MRLRRDIERELTFGHVRVNRQHAPCHAISAGREPWQRDPQQRGIGTVDLGIALVNAPVAPVQNLDGAKFALEPFAEPQFELRRRFVDRAAYTGYRVVEKRAPRRAGRKPVLTRARIAFATTELSRLRTIGRPWPWGTTHHEVRSRDPAHCNY